MKLLARVSFESCALGCGPDLPWPLAIQFLLLVSEARRAALHELSETCKKL